MNEQRHEPNVAQAAMFADIELLPALLGDVYGYNEVPLPDKPCLSGVGAV
jgi:hypothetical protein